MKAANVTIIPQFDEDILQGFGGGGVVLRCTFQYLEAVTPPRPVGPVLFCLWPSNPVDGSAPTISTTSAREAGERKGEEVSGC